MLVEVVVQENVLLLEQEVLVEVEQVELQQMELQELQILVVVEVEQPIQVLNKVDQEVQELLL